MENDNIVQQKFAHAETKDQGRDTVDMRNGSDSGSVVVLVLFTLLALQVVFYSFVVSSSLLPSPNR